MYIIYKSYFKWKNKTKIQLCSNDENEHFLVQNNKNEPEWVSQEVANRLSRLANKIDILVENMIETSFPKHEIAVRLKKRWKNIRSKPNGLRETSAHENTAGYTVDKGEEMRICVRDKSDNGKIFENENTMMFVTLHECAHLMSESYGHNSEFKRNFADITKRAIDLNLYNHEDFRKNNKTYCGIKITDSPV